MLSNTFSLFTIFSIFLAFSSSNLVGAASAHSVATTTSRHTPIRNVRQVPAPTSQDVARSLTNAMRLARGLPLKAPKRRQNRLPYRPQPSGSYSPPSNPGGCIAILGLADQLVGYISKNRNEHGGAEITADLELCLRLSLDTSVGPLQPIDLPTLNGPSERYPYLGIVPGQDGPRQVGQTANTGNTLAFYDGVSGLITLRESGNSSPARVGVRQNERGNQELVVGDGSNLDLSDVNLVYVPTLE